MKTSIYFFLLTIAMTSQTLLSQNQPSSKVVVSEADLISLVEKLKTHRDKAKEKSSDAKSESSFKAGRTFYNEEKAPQQEENTYDNAVTDSEDQELNREIEDIDYKLNELMRQINNRPLNNQSQFVPRSGNDQSSSEIRNVIYTKGDQTEETVSSYQNENMTDSDYKRNLVKTVDSLLNVRDNLESKLDENLENNAEDTNEEDNTKNSKIDSLLQRQKELEAQLNNNSNEGSSDVSDEVEIDEDMLEKLSYSVFFENNSHSLDAKYKSNLDKVVSFLESEPNVKVVLNAYASKSGNADYNLKLSMLRADEVKSYLKSKSIPSERILSDYHGSDPVKEASVARRVEISYLTKKQ